MAVFSDGHVGSTMETAGDFSAWTGTSGSPTVQTSIKHHGNNAASVTVDAGGWSAYFWKDVTSGDSLYARMYFRFSRLPASGEEYDRLMMVYGAGDGFGGVEVRVNYDDADGFARLMARNNYFGTIVDGPQVYADTWYCVETLNVKSGTENWWVDGALQTSPGNGAMSMDRFCCGGVHIGGSSPVTIISDCFGLDTSAIGVETSGPTVKKGSCVPAMTALLTKFSALRQPREPRFQPRTFPKFSPRSLV